MRPTSVSTTFAAALATSVCAAQAKGAAGDLTLNGSAVSGGVATLVANSFVTLTSSGNDTARTGTVYGTDSSGWIVSQTLTLGNAGAVTTTIGFYTVTRVAVSGSIAGTISVGNAQAGTSAVIAMDINIPAIAIALGAVVSGTVNYDVQATLDDIWSTTFNNGTATWFTHPTLVGQVASLSSNYAYPVRAIRLRQNSGSGTTTLTVVQSGITGNS